MSKFHYLLRGCDLHIARSNFGTGNPNGVITAGIIGEFYWDMNANILYVAEATTSTDWFPVVGGIETALVSIILTDWILLGTYYYVDIVHALGSLYPDVIIREGSDVVYVDRIETIDNNTLRLWVPANPDLRFVGDISITRIP